ncbi:hypothetical protein FUAX_00410 [Fulvitalea axinellae]|uniref:Mannosyl-glycoprotein endo-beta-N-acetylglucosaminidase n=1 Tax=Fulvitalea axinellae TaxID=1182444 RepID=A0AAU9CZN4_9BACT|nr:hypothetical protein FUAX_00410 [Fulvitalea axinellae]
MRLANHIKMVNNIYPTPLRTLVPLTIFVLALLVHPLSAQVEHPGTVAFSFSPTASDYIGNWSPNSNSADRYLVSKVPLAPRFSFSASQTNSSLPHAKQMGFWNGMSNKARNSGDFAQNNPHYWQYLDSWFYWNGGDARVHIPSAAYIDAGHRNGTKVMAGCTFADPTSPNNSKFQEMIAKNQDGTYKHARRMVEMAEYYGFDGFAFNIEVTSYPSNVAVQTRGLFQEMTKIARQEKGMANFELLYYYVHYNSGGRNFWIKQVDSGNDKWLEENGKTTFTQAFINYEWTASTLNSSANYVTNNFPSGKNDPYKRVFAGLNMPATERGDARHPWKDLNNNPTSIAMWGGARGARGITPAELKASYYANTMNLWTGPHGNPSTPGTPSQSSGKTKRIAGMASHVTAKSAIDSYPLVTNFNEGCGNFFAKEGEIKNQAPWGDVSIQDKVPTWRWWWSQGGLDASIDFSEAYEGGSCLLVKGDPGTGDNLLRLFKTKLPVSAQTELEVTYKVKNASAGSPSNLEASLAFENGSSLSSFTSIPIGVTDQEGWNTKTIDLSAYSGQTIAVLGLNFTSSAGSSGYEIRIGGISLTNGPVPVPDMAININTAQLQAAGRTISGEITWDIPGNPMYNEDADVEYFEVYQMSDQPVDSVFLGRTLSRGLVFNGIERSTGDGDMTFKVVSVGKDHRTVSQSVSQAVAYEPLPGVSFDFSDKINLGTALDADCEATYADSYQWTFEDGVPATSALKNPGPVMFQSVGRKAVTLTVSNVNGSRTIETEVIVADASLNLALNQPSFRSSVGDYKGAERGNDGSGSNMFCGRSSHLYPNIQPWWMVDLGAQVKISQIKAFKQTTQGATPIDDYHIIVSKTPFVSENRQTAEQDAGITYNHRDQGQMQSPSVYDLSSSEVVGRYVRVQFHDNRSTSNSNTVRLIFSELEIYGEYVPEGPVPLDATVTLDDNDLTVGETANVTVTFTESVTGFGNEDLSFSNGTLSNMTGNGVTFQGVFTPAENLDEPSNTITLDLSGVTDSEGEPGSGTVSSEPFSIKTVPGNEPVEITLNPVADTYAYGKHMNNNYGTEQETLVKEGGTIPYVRRSYFKFDLGQIPQDAQILDATVSFTVSGANSVALSTDFALSHVTNDSWTETGLTWSNMPSRGALLEDITGQASGSKISVNVTNQAVADLADGFLSMEMRSNTKGPAFLWLHTREASDPASRPELKLSVVMSGSVAQRSGESRDSDDVPYQAGNVNVSPNPVSGLLTVVAPESISYVDILSLSGQMIKTVKASGTEVAVDVSKYPKGVYLIRVVTEEAGMSVRRIIKE